MKEIILISYFFPPRGGVGVQRVVKFCRYLGEFGIHPTVLTPIKPEGSFFIDNDLASEVPADIEVHRSFSLEPYHIYRMLGGKRRQDEADMRQGLSTSKENLGLLKKLYFNFQASFLIPDAKIGWFPWAVADGQRVMREKKIEAILSTSPEATDHVIGKALSIKSGVPHILDFRDPWTMSFYCPKRPLSARRRDEALELACLKHASRVVCVQRKYIDDFINKYPELEKVRGKFVVIRNGYDPADFKGLTPVKKNGFNIVYTGSLSYPRDPAPFFQAFADARRASSEFAANARCTFVGEFDTNARTNVTRLGLDDFVEFLPYTNHRTALCHQLGADALLLVSEGYVTAKAYEYLGSGRPIICVSDGAEIRELVTSTRAGRVFNPGEITVMRDYLLELFNSGGRGTRSTEDVAELLIPYTRREHSRQMAELIEEVILEKDAKR